MKGGKWQEKWISTQKLPAHRKKTDKNLIISFAHSIFVVIPVRLIITTKKLQYEVVTMFLLGYKTLFLWNMFFFLQFRSFTTKRQSQIIALNIVYVFSAVFSMFRWIHSNSPACLCLHVGAAYSVCLFISIGFLIYLHSVARAARRSRLQRNCIKRIDNEAAVACV